MIVYSGTKAILNQDITQGNLALKVEEAFVSKLHEHIAIFKNKSHKENIY